MLIHNNNDNNNNNNNDDDDDFVFLRKTFYLIKISLAYICH